MMFSKTVLSWHSYIFLDIFPVVFKLNFCPVYLFILIITTRKTWPLFYLIKNRKSEDTILRICVFSLKKKTQQIVCQDKGLIFPLWNEGGRQYIDLCILYNVLYLTFKIMITERSYCRGPVKNAHPHQYCNYPNFAFRTTECLCV